MKALQLVERLEGVRSTGPHRWIAKCPAHDDRSPSLAVKEADDGTVLVKCFGGCGATEVVSALGLSLKDLFPERPSDHRHKPSRAWFDARDVLACLSSEGQILAFAANDIAMGRAFSSEDADRVAKASGRLTNAWRMVNGHR